MMFITVQRFANTPNPQNSSDNMTNNITNDIHFNIQLATCSYKQHLSHLGSVIGRSAAEYVLHHVSIDIFSIL